MGNEEAGLSVLRVELLNHRQVVAALSDGSARVISIDKLIALPPDKVVTPEDLSAED